MSFRILQCVAALSFGGAFFPSTLSATPSEPIFSQIQPLAASSLILDIANVGKGLVAVGERGHVLVYDGSWHQVATPVSSQLTKVFFLMTKSVGPWAMMRPFYILRMVAKLGSSRCIRPRLKSHSSM